MKKITTPLLVLGICMSLTAFAQDDRGHCGTDQHFQDQLKSDPTMIIRVQEDMARIKAQVQRIEALRSSGVADSVRVIPVVVHVMHDQGIERIGLDQIQSGLDKMNLDFRRLNADTVQTRPVFKPFAVDCKIEFKLAKIDPDGNCTNGVTYYETPLTYNCRDTVKSVIQWPPDKYFNVWIVNSIDPTRWNLPGGGIIAGYEEFPWAYGVKDTYGAVVRYNFWGSKGAATGNNGRTETHELGHCLGLWHPWQDQLVGGYGDGCSFTVGHDCTDNNDMVCDTPPMPIPTYGCDKTQNTCHNDTVGPSPFQTDTVDPIENFMSYDNCQNMFSIGQRNRMEAVFATYPALDNLVSFTNAVATGTDSGYTAPLCAPHAAFKVDKEMICAGASVKFTNQTYGATADSLHWTFPGGTPSSSILTAPTVTYASPGTYNVTLISSNAAGMDTLIIVGMVTVLGTTADYSDTIYSDDLENTARVDSTWFNPETTGGNQWEVTTAASSSGSHSFTVNNFDRIWSGEKLELITPSFDLSKVSNPEFYYKVAYARIDNLSDDKLSVYISTDCGGIWSLRSSKQGSQLATVADMTTPFIPDSVSHWREDKLAITSAYASKTNVRFRFVFESWRGNHIYLDDFMIRDKTTGLEDMGYLSTQPRVFPNPSSGVFHVACDFTRPVQHTRIVLTDLLGRVVYEKDHGTSAAGNRTFLVVADDQRLNPGMYLLQIQMDNVNWNQRVMISNE
ncbi:MAG: choice-of-anchor J domain-containing protein [Flavobacteriales bacterium]|nr:choice-of-anchor J domain-containing protein [Flavobacteriales bacterium]